MRYTMTKKGRIVPIKPRTPKEEVVQIHCVRWFDLNYPKLSRVLFHVPNGGSRNKIEAAKFKKMGVRRGVADLFLSIPNETYSGLYIECKRQGESQFKEQELFEADVTNFGYKYVVCDTVEKFIAEVQNYLKNTHVFRALWGQRSVTGENG